MPEQEFFGKSLDGLLEERQKEITRAAEEAQRSLQREEELRKKRTDYEARIARETAELLGLDWKGSDLISVALQGLSTLADFERIRREFHSLPNLLYQIKYIDRIVYEKLPPAAPIFMDPPKSVQFHYRLQEIGLPMLCPYLKLEDANRTTHQDCTIDEEVIMSLCDGRHDICEVFKIRALQAAQGLIQLRPPKKPQQSLAPECLVDLQDLDDWWLMEGKYD